MMAGLVVFAELCVALAGCALVDGRAVAAHPRTLALADPVLLAVRTVVHLWLVVLWLGLSGRILFAVVAAVITVAVFVGISREKQAYLTEPLVFSDVAFLSHLPRHPEMFYLGMKEILVLVGGAVGLLALIVGWAWFEPRILPPSVQGMLLTVALAVPALAWVWAFPLARALEPVLAVMRTEAAADIVRRIGLLPSLAVGTLGWLAETVPAPAADGQGGAPGGVFRTDVDAVIVIQAESFTDLRRHDLALRLPFLDALAGRAFMRGRLEVPCFGAYTIRPEFGVIAGVPFDRQGLGRFHPYLRPGRFASAALPADLRRAGWRTLFVHPHDAKFFRRDRAIPQLGFERFLGEDAFPGPDSRFGPYVSDDAILQSLIAEIESARAASRPLFAMAVTMESHDPYGAGRLAETDDPVAQYVIHANHADALLGGLVAALDRLTERSIVLFYGDHAPLLPGYEGLAADTATDYIALDCGRAMSLPIRPATSSRRTPDALSLALRNRLGFRDVTDRERLTDV